MQTNKAQETPAGARLRRAWRFFIDNAGYATPPGRAACALALAKAEARAAADGLDFEWLDDADGASMWRADGQTFTTCEGCIVVDEFGERTTVSLWGIMDASEDYRRVIAAELAAEYYCQEERAPVAA